MPRSLAIEKAPGRIPAAMMVQSLHWSGRLAGQDEAFALITETRRLDELCADDGPLTVHFPGTSEIKKLRTYPGPVFVTVHPALRRDAHGNWSMTGAMDIPNDALVCLID